MAGGRSAYPMAASIFYQLVLLLQDGDGYSLSPKGTVWPSPPMLLAPQLSQRALCCLSSVCLLAVDSLLWESIFL